MLLYKFRYKTARLTTLNFRGTLISQEAAINYLQQTKNRPFSITKFS